MRYWKQSLMAAFAAGALFVPGSPVMSEVAADAPVTIRIASLAPPGSSFVRVLKAWGRTLRKDTDGRVELRVLPGSAKDDDRDFVKRMRAGTLDAAGVSIAGLSAVAKPMLVLTAPGLLTDYDQLQRVRSKLGGQFKQMVAQEGFTLLQLGYGGKSRIFSEKEFAQPADLKGGPAWAGKDNPVLEAYLKGIGATPVRGGTSVVRTQLKANKLTTVPASALAAVAFQWYTDLKYVSKESLNLLVGGLLIKTAKLKELTPADQKTLFATAERAGKAMDKIVMRDDARSYKTLSRRGLTEVDLGPNKAKWDAAAKKTREQLAGQVYSSSLLRAVEAAAR